MTDAFLIAIVSEANRLLGDMRDADDDFSYYWAKESLRDIAGDVRGMGYRLVRDGQELRIAKD